VEHGWSRNVLALRIEAGLHLRKGKAVTNFKATLPPAQLDLAQGITKDPYLFDFLILRDDAKVPAAGVGGIDGRGRISPFTLFSAFGEIQLFTEISSCFISLFIALSPRDETA
jgi:hypothetical protein